ncbi:MAG: AfsR/SARP family transcriptional regulator, partial [Acidimicrobiia bacterium]
MEFRVLGPLEVHVSGQQVIIGSSKQRALLTALLVNANSVVATDRLVNLLWRDDASPSARKSLQSCVARLRHRLEASEPKRLIVTRPPGYLVEIDRSRMDASRFEDLARQGSRILRRDPAGALALLDSALSLWCGPAYSELDDDVARAESSRLEELRVAAADDRAVALLAVGRTTEAIGELEAMVADRPLRDRPYGQLMVALAQAGHQVEALRVYQRYRRLLADEVGREPPAALCEQERLILEQVPSVLDVDHLQVPREALGNIRPDATSFVGREHERAEMTAALDRARIVTLVGPGGAGKSRLGLRVASERAHGYRDGVWVADLASIVSPRAVA